MPRKKDLPDYEPLTNPASAKFKHQENELVSGLGPDDDGWLPSRPPAYAPAAEVPAIPAAIVTPKAESLTFRSGLIRRGHALSYFGLFLFTAVLYFRPYELFPALSSLDKLAFVLAIATLVIFIPSQFITEGNLTFRPREVNLVLL